MPRQVQLVCVAILFVAAVCLALVPRPARGQTALEFLSATDITTARSAPIKQGGKEVMTVTLTTSPAALFAVDVPASARSPRFVQNIRLANRSASTAFCVFDMAWSGNTSCATLCGNANRTCSGANTDGAYVASGAGYGESWDGSACLCGVGAGASVLVTTERVMRWPL